MKSMRLSNLFIWAGMAVISGASTAQACSVCFGRSDSKLAEGLNWGIFTLLGVVMMVLTGFGVFAYYIAKRASMNPIPIPPQAGEGNQFANHD